MLDMIMIKKAGDPFEVNKPEIGRLTIPERKYFRQPSLHFIWDPYAASEEFP